MDARSGESNSQHVLFCGDIVWGGDAVQIIHVAEGEKKKRISQQFGFCSVYTTPSTAYVARHSVYNELVTTKKHCD